MHIIQDLTATTYKAWLSLVYGLKLNDLDDFGYMYHDSINNFLFMIINHKELILI